MNGKCFEIGTIQAFLDGETGPEVTLRVTNHIAACDRCATALAEASEHERLTPAGVSYSLPSTAK